MGYSFLGKRKEKRIKVTFFAFPAERIGKREKEKGIYPSGTSFDARIEKETNRRAEESEQSQEGSEKKAGRSQKGRGHDRDRISDG